ncbi:MAG: MATE family efflux transporter [Rhodospirillaceae bacterium]|nr:MATE family efflux transporter [Rhodospirillaceae bacterium]MBT4939574.1 MATE family efflux transporter [Rhodospirillaceae bacterium]MBT5939409.1 MATE family efflux transporter [Rhodospirillaceae bacterium]MBT7268872.1 MATE family efflux transporter [Rhodospirillaceae bacterium]
MTASETFAATIRRHSQDIFRLAVPTIMARAGMMVMMIVDAVMVGHYSAQELAYQSIGLAPMMFMMVTCFGLLTGTLVITAFHVGAKELSDCGAVWRRSLTYALILGLIGAVASLFGEAFLLAVGQTEDLARGGGKIIGILGWSMPPMLIFVASAFFLEGLKRPKVGMYIMIIGNLFNVAVNWILVFGHLGAPELGAAGSAYSTLCVRAIMAGCILYYIWNLADQAELNIRVHAKMIYAGGWAAWSKLRKIGLGAGASGAIESGAFSSMSLFAGLLGILPLGAFSIAFNMLALTFMFALGLGSATAVCVGHAYGRGERRDMAFAGWTGLGLTIVSMAILGLFLIALNSEIAAGFTNNAELISRAAPMIAFISLVLIADGGQSVMAHALRGCGETWVPAALHVVAYLVVMIPLAWYLALPAGHGAIGLFESILVASIISVALASIRFHYLLKNQNP